jgi:hypothetical protein
LVLVGSTMPDSSCLYFQGTSRLIGGAGVAFGDGLRCAAGVIVRLGVQPNSHGGSRYPDVGDQAISIVGSCQPGDVRTYQAWYRNAATQFCGPATFNLTNGIEVDWAP